MTSKVFPVPWNAEPETSSIDCDADWFESGKWHTDVTPTRAEAISKLSGFWQVISASGFPVAKGLTQKNAILVAAAPAMLADLETLAVVVGSGSKSESLGPRAFELFAKFYMPQLIMQKGSSEMASGKSLKHNGMLDDGSASNPENQAQKCGA